MSNFNRLFFDKSYKKRLKQANKSFWVGVSSGIAGLLFFVVALSSIYFVDTEKKLQTLDNNFEYVNKRLDSVIEQLTILKNNKSIVNNESSKLLLNELDQLEDGLNDLSVKISKHLTSFNNNNFIIVSLLGGGFLEIIAIVNFIQYGKVIAQVSDSSDKYQMFYLVNSIYEEFDDEQKKEAFPMIINKIFPEANNNKLLSNTRKEKERGDFQQGKSENITMIEKTKNN